MGLSFSYLRLQRTWVGTYSKTISILAQQVKDTDMVGTYSKPISILAQQVKTLAPTQLWRGRSVSDNYLNHSCSSTVGVRCSKRPSITMVTQDNIPVSQMQYILSSVTCLAEKDTRFCVF
jgi:hypothetical protein